MALDNAKERAAFDEIEGTIATVGAVSFPCVFDDEQAESLLMEGTAPQILCSAARLAANGVVLGTTIDLVETYDGRNKGPYKVVRWQVQQDGAFIVAGLQQL